MPAQLDHLTVAVSDLAASLRFYDAALGALGLARRDELGDEEEDAAPLDVAGYALPDCAALVWVVAAVRGRGASTGAHLAFRVDSRAEVERFHAAGLAAGGISRSAPRRWPIFRRGEFNAMIADPDGNIVEAICAE